MRWSSCSTAPRAGRHFSGYYGDFSYQTQKSWSRSRRVIGKAEVMAAGDSPRFVLTNLPEHNFREDRRADPTRLAAQRLHEELYCARGGMENVLKQQMLAISGNTAPCLHYACARVRSIFRKLSEAGDRGTAAHAACGLSFADPREWQHARRLLNAGLALEAVAQDYRPNNLCNYLHELADHLTDFYQNCPVLQAPEPARSKTDLMYSGSKRRRGCSALPPDLRGHHQ